ncbi:MAG: serine protease [Muribaculaceae bacterium]|nr:serine protease [Muribaculaceae bacterium]
MSSKKLLIIIAGALIVGIFLYRSCAVTESSHDCEEDYYVEDVEGNTLIMNTGLRVKLLGIKEDSKQAEQYIRKNILNNYVDLIRDSHTGEDIEANDDTVYRYVLLKSEGNEVAQCLNTILIDQYRSDVYDAAYVVDSLDVYNSMVEKSIPPTKLSDLALYIKQRTFLIETPEGIGTGFFINNTGTAITNNHVLKNTAGRVWLYADDPDDTRIYSTKTRGIKRIDYTNPQLDITVFTVDLDRDEVVPYFSLADRHAKQGDFCATLGNPHGLTATYSAPGSVSAYRQDPYDDRDLTVMQYTIPTNGGNSGGPVCLENGLVYAVHEMGDKSMQNTNYGIDILEVRPILDKLGIKYGGK